MAGFKNGTRDSKDQPESQCRDDIMSAENDMQLKMDEAFEEQQAPAKMITSLSAVI